MALYRLSFLMSYIIVVYVLHAQNVEYIEYGDFANWIQREIKESAIIGGNNATIYEIGPTQTIRGNKAYTNLGGSPWGTSNVYAKVSGVVKTSNAVYPSKRGNDDYCAMLCSQIERLKVIGLINMDVMVSGSIFLGQMMEPISSTSNPYGKMEMGIPYSKRPKSLILDVKTVVPNIDYRTKATGFGGKKKISGRDAGVIFVFLQRRWEDDKGNIIARRIGTGGQMFSKNQDWINGYEIPITYGKLATVPKWLDLRNGDMAYHARNSKGKMVPVIEEGWDSPDATPTHVVVMISAGAGEAFIGTEGLTLYVDNVGFKF